MATLTRRDSGSQYQLTSPTTSTTFTTLTPFTSYTVTVAASTAIGLGPQSTQLNFITDEDGMSIQHMYVNHNNSLTILPLF